MGGLSFHYWLEPSLFIFLKRRRNRKLPVCLVENKIEKQEFLEVR